jgi:hypothetical protein
MCLSTSVENSALRQHNHLDQVIPILTAASNALTERGILVSPAGVSPSLSDPDETYSPHGGRISFVEGLEAAGFEGILSYEAVSLAWNSLAPVQVPNEAHLSLHVCHF